jgi:hypothetical protein
LKKKEKRRKKKEKLCLLLIYHSQEQGISAFSFETTKPATLLFKLKDIPLDSLTDCQCT